MNSKRVILIGIDGSGTAIGTNYTPNINNIFKNGATTNKVMTGKPTMSAECWGTMLIGEIPSLIGFTNDSIKEKKNSISDKYPSIFKKIRELDKDAKLVSFVMWEEINIGIVEDDINVIKNSADDDEQLKNKIVEYINNDDFKFMFCHFNLVDETGHEKGYNKEEYYKALSRADTYVNDIYQALINKKIIDDTLFIVTTDHGGIDFNHGGFKDIEKYIYFGILGKGINNGTIGQFLSRDIPAIVFKYLNIEKTESFDSYLPSNLFLDEMNPKPRIEIYNNLPKKAINIDVLKKSIDFDHLKLYVNMDNNINDLVGVNKLIFNTKESFTKGFYENGLNLIKWNFFSIDNYKFNNKSFTISLFIKILNKSGNPLLLSNKKRDDDKSDGFTIYLMDDDIKINVGNKGKFANIDNLFYPFNNKEFFNLIITYDSKDKILSSYLNHILESTLKCVEETNFDGINQLIIGQQKIEDNNCYLECVLNELMIFDKALTKNEITNIKKLYI